MKNDNHTHFSDMFDALWEHYAWPITVDPKLVWAWADRVLTEDEHKVFAAFWHRNGTPIYYPSFAAATRELGISRSKAEGLIRAARLKVIKPMRSNPFVFDYLVVPRAGTEQAAEYSYGYA